MGYDSHRFTEARPLWLGGVSVEHSQGLAGHSDADVVLHAVTDAILGAMAAGDIGEQFPDTLAATKGMDSREIVGRVFAQARQKGFRVINLDAVVQAEKPKIAAYKQKMRQALAQMLELEIDAVNLKGRTGEGLGEIGTGQAIACTVVVVLGPALSDE